jgi:hypothetical protein
MSKHVWDFIPELVTALTNQLESDEKRWGDTWLKRTRAGQDEREIAATNNRFDQYLNGGQPIDYLAIIGDAFINWIREQHPEIWKE